MKARSRHTVLKLKKESTRMTFEALRKFEAGILKKIIPVLHSPE